MIKTIKKYIALDYLYFAIPFLCCVVYIVFVTNWHTLQTAVNSVYANLFNLLVVACACVAVPNFARLVYYSKRVLCNLADDICLPSTASERFGGAGEGKTSSSVLQACFEAEKLQNEVETEYYYLKANYNKFKIKMPWKLKNFEQIEKSVYFWKNHPELIPFLSSNVEIRLPDGRKSNFVTREHLEQRKWLPMGFFLCDEAGAMIPQDEWVDRPADVVLMFRFMRHFGYKAVLCEQKKDGILINVRSVLGGTCLCLGQRNALLPSLLLDLIEFLKKRLPKRKNPQKLGLVIYHLQRFASCLGFRIWDQLFFKTMEFQQYKPPETISIVCTNKLPCSYDETAFSDLYLAKDQPAAETVLDGDFITKDSEIGKLMLRSHYLQEEERALKEKKKAVDLDKLETRALELEKKKARLEASNKK